MKKLFFSLAILCIGVVGAYAQTFSASSVHSQNYAAEKAFDGDYSTRWATPNNASDIWIMAEYPQAKSVNSIEIDEWGTRIQSFTFEVKAENGQWQKFAEGTTVGKGYALKLSKPVTGKAFRMNIVRDSQQTGGPTINEIVFK